MDLLTILSHSISVQWRGTLGARQFRTGNENDRTVQGSRQIAMAVFRCSSVMP